MSVKIFGNGKIEGVAVEKKRVEAFTGSGTFIVPAGVTYAIAHMLGGGGAAGFGSAGTGGASSVDFASGLVQSNGALGIFNDRGNNRVSAGATNSGQGARGTSIQSTLSEIWGMAAGDASYNVAGADVTPGASITVTVGAGGAAGTNGADGGSGYVYIEYFEEV